MNIIALILVLLLIFGGLPTWGYHQLGYYPSGLGFILFIILIIVLLRGGL